jgi:citrate lyase subunit beta/citryl-CoA lyase
MRSMLFLPGDSERKIAKAIASDADCIILDLEDAVSSSAQAKEAARARVAQTLASVRRPGVAVRINARSTEWYMADLIVIVPLRPSLIILPKCTGPDDLGALCHHVDILEAQCGAAPNGINILPQVTETADSLRELAYAAATPRLAGLGFAAEDLAADFGISSRRPSGGFSAIVDHARTEVLVAARIAGVPAYDTPYTNIHDPDGLAAEARGAADDGFAGKMCIHPNQITAVNAAFTPEPERVLWAQRVTHAFAASPHAGALELDGRMVDRPHLRLATQILRAAHSVASGKADQGGAV